MISEFSFNDPKKITFDEFREMLLSEDECLVSRSAGIGGNGDDQFPINT